jgi:hypothetical protein
MQRKSTFRAAHWAARLLHPKLFIKETPNSWLYFGHTPTTTDSSSNRSLFSVGSADNSFWVAAEQETTVYDLVEQRWVLPPLHHATPLMLCCPSVVSLPQHQTCIAVWNCCVRSYNTCCVLCGVSAAQLLAQCLLPRQQANGNKDRAIICVVEDNWWKLVNKGECCPIAMHALTVLCCAFSSVWQTLDAPHWSHFACPAATVSARMTFVLYMRLCVGHHMSTTTLPSRLLLLSYYDPMCWMMVRMPVALLLTCRVNGNFRQHIGHYPSAAASRMHCQAAACYTAAAPQNAEI